MLSINILITAEKLLLEILNLIHRHFQKNYPLNNLQ